VTPQAKHDAAVQGAAALPSVGAIATWVLGVPIEKWAAVAGILFIGLQALVVLWRWRRDIRRERERIRRGEPPPPTTDRANL